MAAAGDRSSDLYSRSSAADRERPGEPRHSLPSWLDGTVRAALAAVLGFSLAGMALALAGLFRPAAVVPASLLLAAGLCWLSRSRGPRPRTGRRGTAVSLAAVALILAITALNARYSAQHVLVDRDPGVYAVTGLWLADRGQLTVAAEPDVFGRHPGLSYNGSGFYTTGSEGEYDPQFLHLLPAVMAVGEWIGGSWLAMKMNALLGGLALLAVFGFAARLMRPWLALAMMLALGLGLPQTYITRDAYSEIFTQLFVFGGLALLWDARVRDRSLRLALVAGLLLGATCLTRVDAFLLLIPLGAYLFVLLHRAERSPPEERRHERRWVGAVAAGALGPAVIGALDGLLYSPGYLRDLRPELWPVGFALAVVAAGGSLSLAARRRHPELRITAQTRRRLAALALLGVLLAGVYALALRPSLEYHTTGRDDAALARIEQIQGDEGARVDGYRTYAESSMRWLGWYIGPSSLAIGIVGFAVAARRAIVGRAPHLVPLLLLFAVPAIAYLWRPANEPYQLWAQRRYLPIVLPGLLLFGGWLLDRLWERRSPPGWRSPYRAFAVAAAGAAIAVPASQLAPLIGMQEQGGVLSAIESACPRLERDAAALIVGPPSFGPAILTSIQVACEIPVARADAELGEEALEQIGVSVRRAGKQLVLLSSDGLPYGPGEPDPPGTELLVRHEFRQIEPAITRRPDEMAAGTLTLHVTPI